MLKLPKGLLKLEKNSLVFFECDRSRDWVGFCITPKFLCGCAAGAVAGGGAPPELVPPEGRLMAGKGGGGFHSHDRKWGDFLLVRKRHVFYRNHCRHDAGHLHLQQSQEVLMGNIPKGRRRYPGIG
jgi:hypothetical protein